MYLTLMRIQLKQISGEINPTWVFIILSDEWSKVCKVYRFVLRERGVSAAHVLAGTALFVTKLLPLLAFFSSHASTALHCNYTFW